jgi:hypothetical protein
MPVFHQRQLKVPERMSLCSKASILSDLFPLSLCLKWTYLIAAIKDNSRNHIPQVQLPSIHRFCPTSTDAPYLTMLPVNTPQAQTSACVAMFRNAARFRPALQLSCPCVQSSCVLFVSVEHRPESQALS